MLLWILYWAYHHSFSYAWVAFKTAGHCHFPRLFRPNCNELLDLGLLVRHPGAAPVTDAGVEDDLQNSHCGTLMDYEVVVRRECGAATSKFFYDYWISRIRTGPNLDPLGMPAPGVFTCNDNQLVKLMVGVNQNTNYQLFVKRLQERHPVPAGQERYGFRYNYA